MPSDMMLCVISYWVLSGAKRRQIQQLRCCVLPRQTDETEGCLSEINTTQWTIRLDGVLDKFLKTMQTTATRLQEKLLKPEVRQKGKE